MILNMKILQYQLDGLVQDCGISSALAMDIPVLHPAIQLKTTLLD